MFVSPSGTLYVTDSANHIALIQEIRRGKTSWQYFGGFGTNLQSLSGPTGITAARNQFIFIADTNNDRVMRWNFPYTQAGEIIADRLKKPRGVAVEAHSSLIVPYSRLFVSDDDYVILFRFTGYKRPVERVNLLPITVPTSFAWALDGRLIACSGSLIVFSNESSLLDPLESYIPALKCSKVATRISKDGLSQEVLVATNGMAQFINGTERWVHLGGPLVVPTNKPWIIQANRSAIMEMETETSENARREDKTNRIICSEKEILGDCEQVAVQESVRPMARHDPGEL